MVVICSSTNLDLVFSGNIMKVAAFKTSSAMAKSSPLILCNGPLLFIGNPLEFLQNNFPNSYRLREVVSTGRRSLLTLRLQFVTYFFGAIFCGKSFSRSFAKGAAIRERGRPRNSAAFLLICRKAPCLEKRR